MTAFIFIDFVICRRGAPLENLIKLIPSGIRSSLTC